MRIFVTGPTGWTGSEIVKELIREGHQVLGLARSEKSANKLKEMGAEVIDGDITNPDVLKRGASSCDGVIHLAFIHDFANYIGACETDRAAIHAMCTALKGTNKPFLMTSGTLMVGRGRLVTEDDAADVTLHLSGERAKSEGVALEYAKQGVRVCVMRIPVTNHGAGDQGYSNHLVGTAKSTSVSAYVGDGEARWAAVHRLDTAICYRLAVEKGIAGSVFHIVGDESIRTKDLAEAIGKKFGLPVVSKSENEVQSQWGPMGMFMMQDSPASSRKTREQLGWQPTHPSLIEDIENGAYDDAVMWPVHEMLNKN